jgi:hypothetical protein
MSDIRTEIQFGATAAVPSYEIKSSKTDAINYRRALAAREMGLRIAAAKGWDGHTPQDVLKRLATLTKEKP